MYTRGLEHQDKFKKRKPDSFMYNHQEERHPGDQPEVAEGFLVMRCKKEILNRKFEFGQPTIVGVRREVNTGVTNTVLTKQNTDSYGDTDSLASLAAPAEEDGLDVSVHSS